MGEVIAALFVIPFVLFIIRGLYIVFTKFDSASNLPNNIWDKDKWDNK